MKNLARASIVLLVGALSACASSTSAVIDSIRNVVSNNSATAVARAQLNPAYRYLRVTTGGRVALLVLGYVENHPQGPIEVWYSSDREVLRIQNGRIVGAVGLSIEWRNVNLSTSPSWAVIAKSRSHRVSRVRDVMPGYRFGVREDVVTVITEPPGRSELQGIDPKALTWFSESATPEVPAASRNERYARLPLARFAVSIEKGSEQVVYGEQCLSAEFCFTWQRWPAVGPRAQVHQ